VLYKKSKKYGNFQLFFFLFFVGFLVLQRTAAETADEMEQMQRLRENMMVLRWERIKLISNNARLQKGLASALAATVPQNACEEAVGDLKEASSENTSARENNIG